MNVFDLLRITVFREIAERSFDFRFFDKIKICRNLFRGISVFELLTFVCVGEIIEHRARFLNFIYVLRFDSEPTCHHIERNRRAPEVQVYVIVRIFQHQFSVFRFLVILVVADDCILFYRFIPFNRVNRRFFEIRQIIHYLTFFPARYFLAFFSRFL